jgi:predicted ester cyclase
MSTEDAAARLVRQLFEYQSTGRHAEAAALFADDAINNGRPASGGRVAGILATLAEVFPDERHDVEELPSDGELVAARVRFTGTHSAMPSVPFVLGGDLAAGLISRHGLHVGEIPQQWQ